MHRHRRRHGQLAFVTVLALLGAMLIYHAPLSRADDATASYDSLRTGWDQNEPGLAPASVSAAEFGQLFATQLSGQIYAQPVVARGVLFVATENNMIYGLDPVTGTVLWSRSVGPAWPASTLGCGDLAPTIGVTSTPVVDSSTGTAYFTARVNDGASATHPHWYMHAIDVTTGAERANFPHIISGSASNDPSITFNALDAAQRPGLLLLDGVVYAGFGSFCDHEPYVGYVVGVNARTGVQTAMWATETGSATGEAGVWQSGGGLVSDGPGRIILATGNGISPAPGPGTSPPGQLAESVVRLQVNSNGGLTAKDFFSPVNNTGLDRNDYDLGSGGPMAIPDDYPNLGSRLLVQVGKDGRVFLLDRADLGGDAQGPGGSDNAVGILGPYLGVWGHPAFWGGDGGYVYTITNAGPMRAFRLGVDGTGKPALASAGVSLRTWGYTSGSPVVTSVGTTSGSALVWAVSSTGPTGAGGQLLAYDAVPTNGILNVRYTASIGTVAKFSVPATDGGRVYVGNRAGVIYGFGSPTTAALSGTAVSFGQVPVGSTATGMASVTATQALTVTGVAADAPFATQLPASGLTLAKGQSLDIPVSVTPTSAGPAVGTLLIDTTAGQLGFDLTAFGSQPGLLGTPTQVGFGQVPTTASVTNTVSIMNTDTQPTTITSATLQPGGGPFSADLASVANTTLQPMSSVVIPIRFNPTTTGAFSTQLTVTGSSGPPLAVDVTGQGVAGAPHLSLTPTNLDFGLTATGASPVRAFTVANTGNLSLTITKAAPPTTPFTALAPIAEGQQVDPSDSLLVRVAYSPKSPGTYNGTYLVTGNDGTGSHVVTFHGLAVDPQTVQVPAPTVGGWQLNGTARMSGTELVLTSPTKYQAGDAVYRTAVTGAGLHARFTIKIGGGTGADGMTFALLDPSKTRATSLGESGGALGWAPLPGVAVVLDTYRGTGAPSNNFVGIATGSSGGKPVYAATANLPTSLRTGTHAIDVTTTAASVSVRVDGGPALTAKVAVPRRALLAFTAGTGGLTDSHSVTAVTITQHPPTGPILGPASKCVDVRGGSTANGTTVQLHTCNNTGAQLWSVAGNQTMRALGKCLDVYRSGRTNGTRVDLYACNNTSAQTWVPQGNGTLLNPQSGKCLDDPAASIRDGTPLQLYTCSATLAEKWSVPKT